MTMSELADSRTSMQTFLKARKMLKFQEWLKDQSKTAQQSKNDIVEYFE